MLTKTDLNVLELFVSKPTISYAIREVAREIKQDVKIVHTSMKKLSLLNFFIADEHQHLKLNYKANLSSLVYIESLRRDKFYKKYPELKIAITDFLKKTEQTFFILLVFGSYAEGKPRKASDVDLMLISPNENSQLERQLQAALSLTTKKIHFQSITSNDFQVMLQKREQANIVNECLNRHILIYGAESYYKLLGGRDVR
ncbi:nucleotidyltransferase domain-containing protein [Candidatus Woesearchaeota archaeon]|nr:nucleotidyltransferase domain-containing protein [Candidatus Woesearchaeota archaeon]